MFDNPVSNPVGDIAKPMEAVIPASVLASAMAAGAGARGAEVSGGGDMNRSDAVQVAQTGQGSSASIGSNER